MNPLRILFLLLLGIVAFPATIHGSEPAWAQEKKNHWAWKAPVRPTLPAVRAGTWGKNPIDAFILAKLEAAGLAPAAPAAREQLIRRVTFDLVGLPPTPEEIDAFVNDRNPDAWEKVIERLLASPHYGERWGRHWLDLVRFAESNGYEFDEPRPDAWRYRDYVIASLNADKPYDRFLKEQLAGDELAPHEPAALIATGFNLLGPDMTDSANQQQRRQNTLDDMTDTAGLVFLGLTVGCARCHNHKFEPISQSDYFRLQAFFAPAQFRRAEPKSAKVATPALMSLYETDKAPPKTFVLRRGELKHPGEEVQAGWLTILSPAFHAEPAKIPAAPQSTGRRSALAQWLASPEHPLTARVLVNRLWQHHFGRGLVATPNDFGLRGLPPSHPALLDWLATEFVAHGLSIKQMHRLMLQSATYQQATVAAPEAVKKDPENARFSRMNRLRLEGEIIRDSLLVVGGRLNQRMGGPGVFPPLAPETAIGAAQWKASPDPCDHVRRSVYIFARRNLRFPFLEPFDSPDSNQSCPQRERSASAPQALALLNASEAATAAKALAGRLERAAPSSEDRIALAYRLTLGRRPTDAESRLSREFLDRAPLSELCRALFNVNEFVYLD